METGDVVKLLLGAITVLGGVVALFWRLLDSRAAKRIEEEVSRTKAASDRADRYEEQRDKAMESAKEAAALISNLGRQMQESDTRCREGLAAVQRKLADLESLLSKAVAR